MAQDIDTALSALSDLHKSYEFSIIKLSEQIAAESSLNASRTSDDLFSKLRFSYLEQVTKEKFLRAIVEEPPLIVEHEDNVGLETNLADAKASLKAQKAEVAEMVTQLELQGRSLSRRYETVQAQLSQARDLPLSIRELQEAVDSLRKDDDHMDADHPSQALSLPATLSLLAEEEASLKDLDREMVTLNSTFTRKTKELEQVDVELAQLETQRQTSIKAAREAQRRKAGLDGDGDDLEEKGRWWKGVSEGLQLMLEVET
ncbi:MAG: hypothetical protein M1816_008268 [Peltula sp. TS41687]|nr:MAG: hypothetical protein M1816_008268 [Peltula sp. TS41687]